MQTKKFQTFIQNDSDLIQNIRKKRPNQAKLDIQKLYEQSIELAEIHRKLYEQNQRLKKDYQKVQQAKIQRQQLISQVEKIVKEKSHQLSHRDGHQSSWLVYKLQQKICELKQEIQGKDKAIHKLVLGKENQIILRKQNEVQCLKQINDYADSIGVSPIDTNLIHEDLQEIAWMEEHLQAEKIKVEELECQLQQEERQTNRIMNDIANKKTQLKKMKEIQKQFLSVQENYIQQMKKKEEKMVDNKSYLTNLIKQRDSEAAKLGKLNQKRSLIQEQQKFAILKLQQKLQALRKIYQQNKNQKVISKRKSNITIQQQRTERWVKRVTFRQVDSIAKNMNLSFALKGITQQLWIEQFFKDKLPTYTLQQVIQKLENQPFDMTNIEQRKLLARYVIEDNNPGPMLQDMKTSQDAPIIKSILCKIIGVSKVYTQQEVSRYREELGATLGKFWPLVQQCVHIKQGVRNMITRQMLQQGIQAAELELTPDQINYATLFLFSWSRDINKLQLNKLGKIKQLGIKFD